MSLVLSGQYEWVLYLAAITAAAATWCGIRLVEQWNGSQLAVHAAGFVFAFLPNSLGLSAQLLTDAMFGHVVLVWLYLLWAGLRSNAPYRLLGCGALTIFLQGLKPTFSVAFALLALAGFLVARERKRWIVIGLLGLGTIPAPLFFSIKNYESHGVFTPTMLGARTARDYLMTRYLAGERRVDEATTRLMVREEDRIKAETMSHPESFDGRLYLVRKAAVSRFVRDHPGSVVTLMLAEMYRQFAAPQEYAFQVFTGDLPKWALRLGSLLTFAIWGLCCWGGWRLWSRGDRYPAILVLGVLVFFLATGSVAGLVGARLRFPADMVALPLAAIGFAEIIRRNGANPAATRAA